jgi:SAM-dependent methyltransferase
MKLLDSARRWSVLAYYQIRGHQRHVQGGPWESFWGDVRAHRPDGQVLWDDDPAGAAAVDVERFRRAFDPKLPLIDIGCGNGRQTRYLAQRFRRVIGVDLSASAVDLAARLSLAYPNISYRVLDGTDPEAAAAVAHEVGDVNLYLRGVLHVLPARLRALFVESLRILLGRRGTLYLVEVNQHTLEHLAAFHDDHTPSGLPLAVEQVIKHGVRPRGFEPGDRRALFPESEWHILGEGQTTIQTVPLEGAAGAVLPATWSLLRPRREIDH